MRKASMRLEELLGREPTDTELAEDLDTCAARIASLRTASMIPSSLDARMADDGSTSLGDIVADEKASSPYDDLEEKTVKAMLGELLGSLKGREIEILKGRFGLDGQRHRSLDELAVKLGLTRERVRQLQNKALKKLRTLIEKRQNPQECRLADRA